MSEEGDNVDADNVDVEAVEAAADNMRPEFLLDKYSSVEDQAKAYGDLNTKFGEQATEIGTLKEFQKSAAEIIGAPEDYETPTSENFEVDIEDPRYGAFKEFAKENNLSQGMFAKGLELFAQLDQAYDTANQDFAKAEMEKIPDSESRVKNIQDWLSANVPDHSDALANLLTTADGVKGFEAILEKAGKAPVTPANVEGSNAPSMEEIQAMQFATDANGERKMRDPAYAAKVKRLLSLHVGTGDHQEFVG